MPAESVITPVAQVAAERAAGHVRNSLIPLTDAQHGVWFAEQLGDNGGAYHLGLVVDLRGSLDVTALERAVAAVAARHPVLAAAPHAVGDQVSLRLGVHAIRLEHTGGGQPEPFRLDGTVPLARFALQRVTDGQHRLVIRAHHLVCDGQSKDILLRDLAAAYGTPAASASAGYASAVRSDRERVGRTSGTAREHWREHWVAPSALWLPGGRVVPQDGDRTAGGGTQDGHRAAGGGTVDVPVTAAVRRGLDGAARAAACTRFEFLHAALHLLLHRYGNDTVVTAVDVGTRDAGAVDVVGMFVNELPVATTGPVGGTFADFAAGVRARLRAAYPVRAVPVARCVPVRAGTALSPVSVSYRRQGTTPQFAGLDTAVDWAPFTGASRSALHLQIVDTGDDLVIHLRHGGLPTPDAFAAHLSHLLDGLVADPHAPAHLIEVTPPAEAARLRERLTGAPPTPEDTLTALLAAAAPDPGARIVSGEVELTHHELRQAARREAARLAGLGIGPGRVVGLCAERGVTALVGLLAIVYSGAAYLPLDPQFPAERLRFIIDDAAPALILCSKTGRDALPPGAAPTLVLDLDEADTGVRDAAPRPPRPGDPAYVIYTSGSTGRPKGVVVSHRAIANLLQAMAGELRAGPGDGWLVLTTLSFDISTVECFLPLLAGARMVLADDAQARDGAALLALIGGCGVTHVQATPSTWELILAAGPAHRLAAVTALSGGEPLVPPLAARLWPLVARLVNVYGPTETTVWSTLADVSGPDEVAIGRPLAGTVAHVVDANLVPVPAGVPGRLCLSGTGVADHYHARPSLTAQRFLPDPFGPPGSRLYVTGDQARVRADGTLDCLGRDDLQVKIRGHRIELGEIEARLREHPAVAGAVVTVADDPAGRRLVAYLTGTGEQDEPGLHAHLGAHLPGYMMPGVFVHLPALPTTPNGKVDRGALAPPPGGVPAQAAAATGDDVLDAVMAIWCEALQADTVGPDDDLFDHGGHSLTVTQIAARLRDRFAVDLPLHVLWDAPTARATAAAVRAAVAR